MAVDPYSLCPCGSGKKLKFCCNDLAGDIEKAHRMLEGDQPRAALAHVTQALAKSPGRESLLDLKVTIELSLGDADAARATVEEFVRIDSKSPTAHAQKAIVISSVGSQGPASQSPASDAAEPPTPGRDAVDPLQNALELIEEEMPARVLQAIGSVGQALLVEGNLIAARAHLWLYQGITRGEDNRAMELLARLNQMSGLPLLLRDHLYLREVPEDHAAEPAHDTAQMLASRGQWRRAAAALEALCSQHAELPMLAYNHGLVCGWLGDVDTFVDGMRRFAQMSGPDGGDDTIEAEAIAQLLDRERREPPVLVARTTYEVKDEEALIDRLTRDRHTVAHQLTESELQATDGPPPRQTMLLLDRPLPDTGAGLTAEASPRIIGFLSYYGRQTDRAERLELVADQDDRHSEALAILSEVTGDSLGATSDEEVVGEAPTSEPTLRQRWHFPEDTPPELRRELLSNERRRALLEDWPNASKALLGGKTPLEAIDDNTLRTPLEAALLVLEQGADGKIEPGIFTELRAKLGLPQPETIDPSTLEIDILPLVRIGRVDLSKVSDQGLLSLYERAMLAGASEAVLAIARAGIERPSVIAALPDDELYYRLVSYEPDPDAARVWVNKARDAAEAAGRSSATWDILELEICVIGGHLEEANRLVQHVRSEHLDEPGVAEQLYQLLYALGAVPGPDGQPAAGAGPAAPAAEPAGATESGSKVWTPDSGDSPAPASGGGESKIWTPS